jgi:hypothetical protein
MPPPDPADETAADARTAAVEILTRRLVLLPVATLSEVPHAPRSSASGNPNRWLVAASLAASFGRMLGPLGRPATLPTAGPSGADIYAQAIQAFAASLAPIFMPAAYLLSAGLPAARDEWREKLVPAADGLHAVVLASGLPATWAPSARHDAARPSPPSGGKVAGPRPFPTRGIGFQQVGGAAAHPVRSVALPTTSLPGLGSIGQGFERATLGTDTFQQQVLRKMDEVLKKLDAGATAAEAERLGKSVGIHGGQPHGGAS